MIRLAAERWDRLREFNETGTVSAPGIYQHRFGQVDDSLDFSARDLHECFARYWDVHSYGPIGIIEREFERKQSRGEELTWLGFPVIDFEGFKINVLTVQTSYGPAYTEAAFTMAMTEFSGGYAQPYRHMVDILGAAAAGIAFPLVAHFAFQTPEPARYYELFTEAVASVPPDLPKSSIESLWTYFYIPFRDTFESLLAEEGESLLSPLNELEASTLCEHPGYDRARTSLKRAETELPHLMTFLSPELKFGLENYKPGLVTLPELFDPFGEPDLRNEEFPGLSGRSEGDLLLDLFFALPGVRMYRDILYRRFPPVVVRFRDNKWWVPGVADRIENPGVALPEDDFFEFETAVADAFEIDTIRKQLALRERYGL